MQFQVEQTLVQGVENKKGGVYLEKVQIVAFVSSSGLTRAKQRQEDTREGWVVGAVDAAGHI